MNVTDAVNARKSVRAFLPDPVSDDVIARLLTTASRAPSGGNVQPWRIYVVNGESMTRFRDFLADRPIEPAAYDIYPSPLHEPYRSSRFKVGEDMYATLGIERDDKAGRLAQFAKNLDFFGAPAAIFCFIDRIMGPPQWSDLGMFLQTFMLLAQEAGPRHVSPGGVGGLRARGQRVRRCSRRATDLLRCGHRPRRPRCTDQHPDH